MFKRLVVATFVSAVAVIGIAPAATAAPKSSDSSSVVKDNGPQKRSIDWD